MRLSLLVGGCFLALCSSQASAATQCGAGFQPRGDVCVSQRMSDFIACVEASGGNKQELFNQLASSINNDGSGKASGSANGVVIRGGGSVEVGKNVEQRLNSILSEKYFGNAMDVCRQTLSDIAPSSTPPVEPPKPTPPPAVVTYKVCVGEYERACQPHDVYKYCYTDVSAWAKQQCASSSVSRYSTYGGNKCGYGMDLVTCVGPK